jgi:hypothetical protein
MKEQLYKIASAATNIDTVSQSEIENGILANSYASSPKENLFHNYSSEQLYSLSTELKNLLVAYGITLSSSNNTQILNLLKYGILEWSATITYSQNDIVKIGTILYYSRTNSNLNHNPVSDTTNWRIWTELSINTQTSNYTLVLTDQNKLIEMNSASALNLTVPLDASVAFSIGTTIGIVQYGAGQITVVATSGVTINSARGLKLSLRYSGATLTKRDTNEWYLNGDTTI